MVMKAHILNVDSRYENSDWHGFLSCWKEKYVNINGSIDDSIISKHMIDGFNNFNADDLRETFGVDFPKSYCDFMKTYNPESEWLRTPPQYFESFMLPSPRISLLRDFDPVSYKIWTKEEQFASDERYYFYGPGQDYSVFRSFQYDHLIVVGKNSQNDLIMLNPCVKTIDGEMEVVLHTSSSISRTLSFATMMKSMYHYECGSPSSYPPYSNEILNAGCGSLIKAVDPNSALD